MKQDHPPPTFRRRGLLDIAGDHDVMSPASRVHHASSLAPAHVALPDIAIGRTFLENWPIREGPGEISWRDRGYECIAPATFVFRDVLVHSSAGIIGMGNDVIGETLAHTSPERQNYSASPAGITLPRPASRRLAGTHITILAGGKRNYFHAAMESMMRLSILSPYHMQVAESVLVPAGAVAQESLLALPGLPAHLDLRPVSDGETFSVDTLIFPWTAHGLASYHPCVLAFFERISDNVADDKSSLPRRILIDRGGAKQRPLSNEAELADRLARLASSLSGPRH